MIKKYPDLERGESADKTGRNHIPPRVFKEMTHLTKQKEQLEELLTGINLFNAKGRTEKIAELLDAYIPAVEQMHTILKKYQVTFTDTAAENERLRKKNAQLTSSLNKASQQSTFEQLSNARLQRDYEKAIAVLDQIPKDVLNEYVHGDRKRKGRSFEQSL